MHRVQDAISHDPAKAWNLRGLARIAGASNRHLSRLFHEHAGMNITDYINRLRVTLAHELISQTRLDIEQVAERAGFGSTRQLRRAWRRQYGTTPRQARAVELGTFQIRTIRSFGRFATSSIATLPEKETP